MTDTSIRFDDPEAAEMLQVLAKSQKRSMGNQVAWLIRKEFEQTVKIPIVGTIENGKITKYDDAAPRIVMIQHATGDPIIDPELSATEIRKGL